MPSQHRSAGEVLDQLTMTEELTKNVVAWASEIAGYAARLPSRQARDSYLDEEAEDALVLDNSDLSPDRSIAEALRLVEKRLLG